MVDTRYWAASVTTGTLGVYGVGVVVAADTETNLLVGTTDAPFMLIQPERQ